MDGSLELILGVFARALYRNRNGWLQTAIRWMLYVTTSFAIAAGLGFGLFSIVLSNPWVMFIVGFGAFAWFVVYYGELDGESAWIGKALAGLATFTAVVVLMRAISWPNLLPW